MSASCPEHRSSLIARKHLGAAAGALLWLCLPSAGQAQPQSPPCTQQMQGHVYERFEGVDEPYGVPDAHLIAQRHQGISDEDAVVHTHTGMEGDYVLDGLCAGTYHVIVQAQGYVVWERDIKIAASPREQPRDITLVLKNDSAVTAQTVTTTVKEVRTTSLASEALDGRALDETRGESLGQALAHINGVSVIETGTVAKPMIHGMHSSRVPLIFDGVRHEAQSWGLDHGPEIDPFAADRLVVLKGAAGVRYGAGAIGGVILVDPTPLPQEPGSHGTVHAVGVSNGWQGNSGFTLTHASERVDGLALRLQGSTKKAGALQTPDYILDNTGSEELNFSGALGFQEARWGAELAASRFDSTLGLFTGLVNDNANQFRDQLAEGEPGNVDLYRFDYDIERPRQEITHTLVKGKGWFVFDNDSRIETFVAHQRNARQEYDIVRGQIEGPQLDFTLRTTSTEVVWRGLPERPMSWTLGVAGSWQDNLYSGRRFIPNYRAFSGGVFGSWMRELHARLKLELGARLDTTQMTTYQRERVGGSDAPITSTDFLYLNPSLVAGLVARQNTHLSWALNLSSASRPPTINELFVDGVSQGMAAFERGLSTLSSEQVYAASTDLEVSYNRVGFHATPYVQYVKDYIYNAPELNSEGEVVVRQTINGGFPSFVYTQVDASFAGVDAALELYPTEWVEVDVKAAIVRARDLSNDAYLVYIPPDTYSAHLIGKMQRLGPFHSLHWNNEVALTRQQDRVDLNADFAPPPPAYALLHSSLTGTFFVGRTQWSGGIEARNLLNQRYRNYLSRQRYVTIEPGRSIIGRLKLDF